MEQYYPMLIDALGMFLFLGIELSLLFILISAGVSLLQQYIPDSKIQAILSGKKGWGYVFAAVLGAITPFCSCSTIPMLRGLLKAKAGFGPTLTFLFSSPLLNPIIIGLFVVTFGLKVTVIYSVIALLVSVLGGLVLSLLHFEKYIIPEESRNASKECCSAKVEPTSCCASEPESVVLCGTSSKPVVESDTCCSVNTESDSCGSIKTPSVFAQKLTLSFQEAWEQFRDVFPYLLIGVSLGAFVYGFVPSEWISANASGDSLLAVPISAIIGIPLYVRAEALIPLSAVLVSKGMGLGAVMALIIGGSGASITEVILLKSMFKMPMIIAFLTVIIGMAIFAGYLFQFIL